MLMHCIFFKHQRWRRIPPFFNGRRSNKAFYMRPKRGTKKEKVELGAVMFDDRDSSGII